MKHIIATFHEVLISLNYEVGGGRGTGTAESQRKCALLEESTNRTITSYFSRISGNLLVSLFRTQLGKLLQF